MNETTLLSDRPELRHRLSTRIIASSAVALVVVLSMIAWTLLLSWQLEGAGGAINDSGSLRMRANSVAVDIAKMHMLPDGDHDQRVRDNVKIQDDVLAQLKRGNPARPLFLPDDRAVLAQMAKVLHIWKYVMKPAALDAANNMGSETYFQVLPEFVHQADKLVRMIEEDSSGKTSLLRLSQGILIVIACIGTLAMIYLLYLWIIYPILRLGDGLHRMAGREFGVRLPIDSMDEFGVLAAGFNKMAGELEGLYGNLEARVVEKTSQLAQQNRALSALYDMAAFLSQPNEIEDMCRGFLDRVMKQFGAEAGTIRTLDPSAENLTMVVSRGLSAKHDHAEHCMKTDDCFCGAATRRGVLFIQDIHKVDVPKGFRCAEEGFRGLAVFRIQAQKEVLGSYSLHFIHEFALGVDESYQDVRELLGNFRSRLGQGDLLSAVEATVARFRRQSGIEVMLIADDGLAGPPLPPEQQLQVLFILQEALSNVRKHAHASKVEIKIENRHDFRLQVSDDGKGYDPVEVAGRIEEHFGRRIMHERAQHMQALLELRASPGGGASVSLLLPAAARQAA